MYSIFFIFSRLIPVILIIYFFLCVSIFPAIAAGQSESLTVNRVVAVVNGEMITSFDLEMAAAQDLIQARIDPRKPENAEHVHKIMREALDKMISDIIVVQEAERMKISATDRDVDIEFENMARRAKLSPEELLEQLSRQGMKEEQVRDRLKKRILQQRLLSNMVGRKVVISKNEVEKHFADMGNVFILPGQVRFAVLVYAPKASAEQFARRIKQGSISFEEAVRSASIGPRRSSGGHLDIMGEDEVIPSLAPHIKDLPAGAISDIFIMDGLKTQVKILERVAGKHLTSFEEAAPYVEDSLRQPRLAQRYNEYLEQLRKKAIVDIRLEG